MDVVEVVAARRALRGVVVVVGEDAGCFGGAGGDVSVSSW